MRMVSPTLRGATTTQRSKTIPFQLGRSARLKFNRTSDWHASRGARRHDGWAVAMPPAKIGADGRPEFPLDAVSRSGGSPRPACHMQTTRGQANVSGSVRSKGSGRVISPRPVGGFLTRNGGLPTTTAGHQISKLVRARLESRERPGRGGPSNLGRRPTAPWRRLKAPSDGRSSLRRRRH
jgi:hypothetical protein